MPIRDSERMEIEWHEIVALGKKLIDKVRGLER